MGRNRSHLGAFSSPDRTRTNLSHRGLCRTHRGPGSAKIISDRYRTRGLHRAGRRSRRGRNATEDGGGARLVGSRSAGRGTRRRGGRPGRGQEQPLGCRPCIHRPYGVGVDAAVGAGQGDHGSSARSCTYRYGLDVDLGRHRQVHSPGFQNRHRPDGRVSRPDLCPQPGPDIRPGAPPRSACVRQGEEANSRRPLGERRRHLGRRRPEHGGRRIDRQAHVVRQAVDPETFRFGSNRVLGARHLRASGQHPAARGARRVQFVLPHALQPRALGQPANP